MFNGRLSPSSGLYSRQTVLPLSIDTLNVMSVVHLYKWDTLAVAVRSDNPFQVLEDSTFSVIMHGRFTASREKIHLKRFIPEGEGVLSYKSHIGMCRPFGIRGMVFEGTSGVYERTCCFNSKSISNKM